MKTLSDVGIRILKDLNVIFVYKKHKWLLFDFIEHYFNKNIKLKRDIVFKKQPYIDYIINNVEWNENNEIVKKIIELINDINCFKFKDGYIIKNDDTDFKSRAGIVEIRESDCDYEYFTTGRTNDIGLNFLKRIEFNFLQDA